jgi:hypothetical protein
VSDIAPPFVGFIELSQMPETARDEMLGKMLSGKHPAYVYSSKADGRLEPVRIKPAEFFKAWRRAQQEAAYEEDCLDASGWPLKKMDPFQIRVPDRDIRRDRNRLARRTIGVPHWIYLLQADVAPPKGKGGRKTVVDWSTVDKEVERLMDHHMEFGADAPDWNAQARLVEAIQRFCFDKFGTEPGKTTVEDRIKEPLAKWRARRTARPKT